MSKYQILKHDYVDIRHPVTQKNVRIYRIISLQEINNLNYGIIPPETIGGYIESESNLDTTDGSWVFHTAKVFDRAKISKNTVVMDNAAVYGDTVVENSIIKDWARVHEAAYVADSVLEGKCTARGRSKVMQSTMMNSTLADNSAVIQKSTLSGGSMVRESGRITKCKLSDTAEVCGNTIAENCHYSGRYTVRTGNPINETMHEDIDLRFESGRSVE
jgi:NDP-sugar pyrophosphorylase family protein